MTTRILLLVLALLGFPAFAADADLRAEPEIQPAPSAKAALRAPHALASRIHGITLDAFVPDLSKSRASSGKSGTPLQVGFPRPVAALATPAAVAATLEWEPLANGGQVAALSVTTPGATAVRMGLRIESLPDGALMRFYAPGADEPFEASAAEIRAAAAIGGTYWSPAVESETLVAEVEIPAGVSSAQVRISSPMISHLVASASTAFVMPKATSEACNLDVMCYQGTWALESSAVARILFTDEGKSYVCSGTLVADRDTSTFVPYFLTANHCVSTQATASTVQSYWFYRATACNSGTRGVSSTLFGGATLLYAAETTDTSFLRLNGTPPAGAGYVGWNVGAATPTLGTGVTGIHHPSGDLQKISFGNVSGYGVCTPSGDETFSCRGATPATSTFLTVLWRDGITEGGSSGSSLFLDNGRYLIGQLYGGDGSCSSAASTDYYGRFDVAYNAALFQWLGSATSAPTSFVPALNYSDLWWNAAESGWGIAINQHSDSMIFATWYVYAGSGRPLWLSMSGGKWISPTAFSGDLYSSTGPDAVGAFNPAFVGRTKVGSATLSFASTGQAAISYTVNGVTSSKAITRMPFGPLATALAANYTDLWWNAAESGWGISINQQFQTLFAVWYSYGSDGQPVWYSMSGGTWTSGDTYTGALYRTSAGQFFGVSSFNANAVTRTAVGSLTLRFSNANAATMSYTVDGVSGSKAITRLPF
jgi:lysyl endopeptidase